jgi:hypothetical protein
MTSMAVTQESGHECFVIKLPCQRTKPLGVFPSQLRTGRPTSDRRDRNLWHIGTMQMVTDVRRRLYLSNGPLTLGLRFGERR